MASDGGFKVSVGGPPAHNLPDIGAGHGPERQLAGTPDRCPEERALPVIPDAGSRDISIEIGVKLVVARHLVDLAVLLTQPEPPALPLRVVVFDLEIDDGRDAAEGEGHDRNEGAVTQADDGCRVGR